MHILSSGAISPSSEAEPFPKDDIDRLFEKLPKLEPPGDIIKQILARIKQLPAPWPSPQAGLDQFADKTAHSGLQTDLNQSSENQEAVE
ncbi:MAG TPA: hypothetical protein VF458_09090 [Ktedonobacteraceae bacterium]